MESELTMSTSYKPHFRHVDMCTVVSYWQLRETHSLHLNKCHLITAINVRKPPDYRFVAG